MSWLNLAVWLLLQVNLDESLLVPGRLARGHVGAGLAQSYKFYGRAGQTAEVQLTGTPGVSIEVTSAGHIPSPLPGAARRDRAHHWRGPLPRSGPYRVSVRAERAADFQLQLRLR